MVLFMTFTHEVYRNHVIKIFGNISGRSTSYTDQNRKWSVFSSDFRLTIFQLTIIGSHKPLFDITTSNPQATLAVTSEKQTRVIQSAEISRQDVEA